MKKWLLAALTFCLLLSGYGSALKVSAHEMPPTLSELAVSIQAQSPCQVFEDQLGTLGRLLRASRVYFDGDSLDARGFADLVAARKSWQSQMSQVGAKLQRCLSTSSATA
jgi:hypothetical protein